MQSLIWFIVQSKMQTQLERLRDGGGQAMSAPRRNRRCANAVDGDAQHKHPNMAITVQLATVGETQRRRAQAGTVYLCKSCGRDLDDVTSKRAREAIAKEIKRQMFSLGLQLGR